MMTPISVGKKTIYLVSFFEGLQRIILFTEDPKVFKVTYESEKAELAEQEIVLALQDVGISLVNNYTKQEVAYIGITRLDALILGIIFKDKTQNLFLKWFTSFGLSGFCSLYSYCVSTMLVVSSFFFMHHVSIAPGSLLKLLSYLKCFYPFLHPYRLWKFHNLNEALLAIPF